ncbi:MAG: type II toxin-antitoxin system RelE/ParE family toxin [Dysgonamonadaceae bacterium]|jgi:mRNA-degrading endonuclease RelE of RelBE toxin-antitoxin system|nr:type II toxin-antitoxin system RelE/ParE family toxin [Dysgonamonadaceae bacterium]
MKRTIHKSKAFEEFYFSLNSRTKKKIEYILQIIQDEEVVSTKFVKKIVNSDFYEMRISADNEYRIINFTMDDDSFIRSNNVLLLNGFIKKSESDYAKQILLAQNIMQKEEFINENND